MYAVRTSQQRCQYLIACCYIILLILLTAIDLSAAETENRILICVNQFANHPALDAAYSGMESSIQERIKSPNVAIKFNNAQGSIANAVQIAQYHASLKPDIMVAIATQSAQADLKTLTPSSVLAFAAVTDAQSAGLAAENIIGVTDTPPVAELLDIACSVTTCKNIGIIFNPGEVNSVKMIERISQVARNKNLKVNTVAINSPADIKIAIQKLSGSIDLIYLTQDNMVVSAIDNLAQFAQKAKIPIVANDPALVANGVFIALGCNYFQAGVQLGNMIADLVEKRELRSRIVQPQASKLVINYELATKLGIKIPNDLKLRASQ